jgi:TPR repeat protein
MEVDLGEEMKEQRDQCSICLEDLPKWAGDFTRMTCCGNGLHIHCAKDLMSTKMIYNCILCRAKTPTSDEECVKFLRPWVKKKKAWAQTNLAGKYRDGEGVKQSYEMAIRPFELAAQQGDDVAMYNVGTLYAHGEGVEQSYEKAFEYYEQAAHLGDAQAQYNLGVLYEQGYGVERSLEKAAECYQQAAREGNAMFQNALGQMFLYGDGVEQSDDKAREWLSKAAAQGNEKAIEGLKRAKRSGE